MGKKIDVLVENKMKKSQMYFGRNEYLNGVIFGGNEKNLSDPITCGEYLIWRFGKAFSYRK